MVETSLLRQDENGDWVKPLAVLPPDKLRNGLSPVAWNILEQLQEEPAYPGKVADTLDINEQTVYYHIRRLRDNNLIEPVKEEEKHGATATYYKPVADVFAAELPGTGQHISITPDLDQNVLSFFHPFIHEETFTGTVVVGAPHEHGPYDTEARDGHHGIALGMFLGQYCILPTDRLPVRLDTEVEPGEEDLVLIGGPLVNTVTHRFNTDLPVRFMYEEEWCIVSDRTGERYRDETAGVVARFPHPGNEESSVVLLAGLQSVGTATCVTGITQYADTVLDGYTEGEPFYRVITAETGEVQIRE